MRHRLYPLRSNDAPDLFAVDRLCAGDPPARFTVAERRAAVLELTGRGWSAAEVADQLCCSVRTVVRYRRSTRRIYQAALVPCGTATAYQRHLRHGETPCAPCRAASSAVRRRHRGRAA